MARRGRRPATVRTRPPAGRGAGPQPVRAGQPPPDQQSLRALSADVAAAGGPLIPDDRDEPAADPGRPARRTGRVPARPGAGGCRALHSRRDPGRADPALAAAVGHDLLLRRAAGRAPAAGQERDREGSGLDRGGRRDRALGALPAGAARRPGARSGQRAPGGDLAPAGRGQVPSVKCRISRVDPGRTPSFSATAGSISVSSTASTAPGLSPSSTTVIESRRPDVVATTGPPDPPAVSSPSASSR